MTQPIEAPAAKQSISNRKPIYGVGINDANYVVVPTVDGKKVWCPYYRAWNSMITRCYSNKLQSRRPTYIGCSVVSEWLTFSIFREWMRSQDWKGNHLDKDILIYGNKTYGPSSCVFVSREVNSLITDGTSKIGRYPKGIYLEKSRKRYAARCSVNNKNKSIGYFKTVIDAELAYLEFKSSLIENVANGESEKVKAGLLCHARVMKNRISDIKSHKPSE